ncbi:hypothetical protein [Ralstonia phage phiRSL1]|uniref:Uncharacterized protein n=1 Tax=Ralstonia phage phiRSL1 TaxID=1980924 RepID=B2ZXN7_9CAUD|nr:hypothetical protein RSL1_ORF017 [Ralstonia phage phiRSL1]BAG41462.1 hypothetical protein [Ralstonia phage phiRSL1]
MPTNNEAEALCHLRALVALIDHDFNLTCGAFLLDLSPEAVVALGPLDRTAHAAATFLRSLPNPALSR